jgi:DNA-binding transcriptional LysR family regulator
MPTLDPESVEAFVLTAEMQSFTRAAQILNSTQAAVSLKVKRLEDRLGHRLLDRTPRRVSLSRDGETFLDAARDFVRTHKRALAAFAPRPIRLTLGVTHHLVGPGLPMALKRVGANDPNLVLDLRIGDTRGLLELLDSGKVDAAIVLRHGENRRAGERLFAERFSWFGAPDLRVRDGEPMPIAVQPEPCQVRELTVRALTRGKVHWREAIVGGGAIAVGAAATAGLAIAAMARTAMPPGVVDVTRRFRLPTLPSRDVVLHSNARNAVSRKVLLTVVGAIQAVSSSVV